jgi:hypothetical protein
MAGLSRRILRVLLGAVTGLLHVTARSFLLMRRMRMILRLKVLGLVGWTFAAPDHEFSQCESGSDRAQSTPIVPGGLAPIARPGVP